MVDNPYGWQWNAELGTAKVVPVMWRTWPPTPVVMPRCPTLIAYWKTFVGGHFPEVLDDKTNELLSHVHRREIPPKNYSFS